MHSHQLRKRLTETVSDVTFHLTRSIPPTASKTHTLLYSTTAPLSVTYLSMYVSWLLSWSTNLPEMRPYFPAVESATILSRIATMSDTVIREVLYSLHGARHSTH